MDLDTLKKENESLKETIKQMDEKLKEYEEKIKKYTNSTAHKEYYEQHKDEIKAKGKQYLLKLKTENPDKLKAYWRKSNEKRKLKNLEIVNN